MSASVEQESPSIGQEWEGDQKARRSLMRLAMQHDGTPFALGLSKSGTLLQKDLRIQFSDRFKAVEVLKWAGFEPARGGDWSHVWILRG